MIGQSQVDPPVLVVLVRVEPIAIPVGERHDELSCRVGVLLEVGDADELDGRTCAAVCAGREPAMGVRPTRKVSVKCFMEQMEQNRVFCSISVCVL